MQEKGPIMFSEWMIPWEQEKWLPLFESSLQQDGTIQGKGSISYLRLLVDFQVLQEVSHRRAFTSAIEQGGGGDLYV